ncbi:MAG: NAD(P)/FAD-dependent oxidoreductase [Alphaproteobacteria bacterium]|jgi:monoamine oxidase|nr:NAD(P)/FAD-dependent oxidoreductase [Alphaproteobacteria bacterium]
MKKRLLSIFFWGLLFSYHFVNCSDTCAMEGIVTKHLIRQTPVLRQLTRIAHKDQLHKREIKHIKVIGGGIAGLTAAYELNKLGHKVEIIEASRRVGGRIWTHAFESTGQYGELGAMRIPASHDYALHYIGVAGLIDSLRPFITAHQNTNCFYHLRGKACRMRDATSFINETYHLSPYEQELLSKFPPPEILRQHISSAIQLVKTAGKNTNGDPESEENWGGLLGTTFLSDHALELEGLSLGEFLKRRMESPSAKELVGVTTGLELWWDKAVSMFLREGITETGDGLQEIVGGFSRLPNALSDLLRSKVNMRLNTEVVSLELLADPKHKVLIRTRPTNPTKWDSPPTNEKVTEETADYVICTIPFSVLRMMDIKGLSPMKMEAIRNLSYASSSKVLLHFQHRFWEDGSAEERILGGASMSDQITRCTYYPSDHAVQTSTKKRSRAHNSIYTVSEPLNITHKHDRNFKASNPGVLLGSYNWGQDAIRLGALPPDERAEVVIKELEKIHPEIRQHIHPREPHMAMFWDSYRWSRGAFCGMRANDMREYHHISKQREGNLFFAGEHCSLDSGWIQGAIKSALDVVEKLSEK